MPTIYVCVKAMQGMREITDEGKEHGVDLDARKRRNSRAPGTSDRVAKKRSQPYRGRSVRVVN